MLWAQVGPWGHVARRVGAIRAVRRAWQVFFTSLALGIFVANPRCFRNIHPGMGYIPVYVRKIWM